MFSNFQIVIKKVFKKLDKERIIERKLIKL